MMTKISWFMESITTLNKTILIMWTHEEEREKKEKLKEYIAKIKKFIKPSEEENNKRKINEIAETLD